MLDVDPASLLGQFQRLPDPRRRQGRRYPLPALLGLLVLGALHGESSLRGIWLWARANWSAIWFPLGFGSPHFPALTTIWNLLGSIDADDLDRLLAPWLADLLGQPEGGLSADGKVLRGSRRHDLPGRQLVALARHDIGTVVRQRQVARGSHELPTLVQLLREVPLRGQIVTMDAGLLCAETTQVVREQQGDYLGVVKNNHAEVKAVLDDWVTERLFSPSQPACDGDDGREITWTPGAARGVGGGSR